jgi:hypothetical protein
MKQIKYVVIYFSLLLLIISCEVSDQSYKNATEFSLLNGKEFTLKVDRISENPDVQFPMDDLQESDYQKTNGGAFYNVSLSEDGQIVMIEPGSIRGTKVMDGDKSKLYELEEGEFAGGRFIVWISNNKFEAELTIYGSGVPIVKSERGFLGKPSK